MAKIDIISGFLGAGKTTLIKKLVAEAFQGEKLVIIENEFGEIGIDGGFLKESGIQITEMNSGCICCSLVGDFSEALKEVLEKYSPDRVIIEPSGVGKLSDVAKAVKNAGGDVQINSTAVVVDASKCKMYMKNYGEFYNNQVEYAGTIILSRTQKISDEKLETCLKLITTPWDDIDGKKILEAMEKVNSLEKELLEEHEHHHHHHEDGEECHHGHHHENGEECCHGHHHEDGEECCHHGHDGHGHHHHHADEVFTSWGVETAYKFTEEELKDIVDKLSTDNTFGEVLRAKGIVASTEGEWFHFDLVPEETEIRKGAADFTGRVCVIGSKLNENAIKDLFHVA